MKKYIYQLEKQQHGHTTLSHSFLGDVEASERSGLLDEHDASNTNALFIPLLDRELKKITLFYESQEKELVDELVELEEDVNRREEAGLEGNSLYLEGSDDDDDDESVSVSQSPERRRHRKSSSGGRRLSGAFFVIFVRQQCLLGAFPVPGPSEWRRSSVSSTEDPRPLEEGGFSLQKPMGTIASKFHSLRDSWNSGNFNDGTIWTAKTDYAYDTRILFKRRITTLYISFTNLRSYVDINYTGFRKIIKKYDKVTYSELKDKYLHEVVEIAPPFTQTSKDKVNECINRLVDLYARCVTHHDRAAAKQQLRLHQRENIVWERDTVWRQMIGRERRGEGSRVDLAGATLVTEPEAPLVDIPTPVGHFRITGKLIWGAIAVAVFSVLLSVRVVETEAANNCFAILVFCTLLWASEVCILFLTPLMLD